MTDICVPLPRMPEASHAEVEVKVAGKTRNYHFRVESFDWRPDEESADRRVIDRLRNDRIHSLRSSIEGYDRNWELVQIYNPGPRDRHIQVLFRQRPF